MAATHRDPRWRAITWMRRNLFRGPFDSAISLIAGAVAAWVLFKAIRFVFVTGRWEVIQVNLRLLLYGRFPEAHVLRLAVALVVLSAWAGVIAGVVHRRQIAAGRMRVPVGWGWSRVLDLVRRFWIVAVVGLLLLSMAETAGPWLAALAATGAAVAGRIAGGVVGRARLAGWRGLLFLLALTAVPVAVYVYVVDAVGYDEWGGFLLNLFLAACAIILCYPLGVLLALGRRSSLPLIRLLCTVYIEVLRGAPLFVLLLFANVALGFFVPRDAAPSTPTRAIVVFTLFTAAYMAEIVRGGLQSVPRGQFEAAKALGLSPPRQTFLVVLPQAMRNVIPAQIGQVISLFKDTALAGVAMGLFELLNVSQAITSQDEFRGQGLIGETLAFGALLFWSVSYTMSRESQRLERRLGVGTR
jgi:general L-amino acid transport system permease protein